MSEEPEVVEVEKPKKVVLTPQEKKAKMKERFRKMQAAQNASRGNKKYLNPLKATFRHVKGKLRFEKFFKYEKAPGWHCLHYWDKGDIRTLWLADGDWFLKTETEKLTADALVKKMTGVALPSPTATATAPPPLIEKAAAPTEYYPIKEARDNPGMFSGMDTVSANAEAEFARQEANRKISLMRHQAEIRAQNTVSLGRSVTAGWE